MAKLWELGSGDKPQANGFPVVAAGLDPELDRFLSSLSVDERLLEDDLVASEAHARMLGESRIIPQEDARALEKELGSMLEEARAGTLVVDQSAEDVHSFIEDTLTRRLGDAGKAVHAGRSRNDQVATALRLWILRAADRLEARTLRVIEVLLDLAAHHTETLMPGYTHLQRAQPVSLAHHLLAWCAGLERDVLRISDARMRACECPLGSGALAGSGLQVNREATAARLGFRRPTRNTMDSVADRDACVELVSACAMLMTRLSRACEEIILWASTEFRFVTVGPRASTGSSIMPQKRNPDPAELIRGKTGRVTGALVSLLTLQKGLAYAYDRDLQEDKAALFDAVDTTEASLGAFAILAESLVVHTDRMRKSADEGFLEATDVAEFLVRRGIPFRTAYGAAKSVVLLCLDKGVRPAQLSTGEIRGAHEALMSAGVGAEELAAYLDLDACMRRRTQTGGPAPERTGEEIGRLRLFVAERRGRGSSVDVSGAKPGLSVGEAAGENRLAGENR